MRYKPQPEFQLEERPSQDQYRPANSQWTHKSEKGKCSLCVLLQCFVMLLTQHLLTTTNSIFSSFPLNLTLYLHILSLTAKSGQFFTHQRVPWPLHSVLHLLLGFVSLSYCLFHTDSGERQAVNLTATEFRNYSNLILLTSSFQVTFSAFFHLCVALNHFTVYF